MAFYMAFFQPWNWIITVSACRDEFRQFVKTSDFRDQILALRFGATGYPFLMDTQGNLLVHPDLEGKNILELRDAAEKPFIRELLAKKSGRLTYLWKDPGASTARERLLVFRYLPEMDWIVASSSCLEEFYLAGAQFAWITGVILLLSAALAGAATFAISRALTGSLIDLAERVSCVGEGSFDPLPVEGTDEVGTLAAAFNGFLARIQRSQHHLEESEGRYRRLFEQAVEGIFQCTREGRFLTANPSLAQTLGYGSPEEILAEVEHIREDLHLDPRTWMDLWCRLDSAGVVLGFQAELRRRDGRSVWVRINARAVNQGGASAYMEGFLSDITEEKHHREALVEQQRVLEDRVENRTSELRGGIERLERHNAEVAELHEFTEMLQLCQDLPEGIPIIEAFLPRLFSGAAAELFILDPISELLMPITQGTHDEFPVEACWALREGKPYARSATGSRPRCAHLEGLPSGDSLCLPVLAGRELHGLIQVLPAGPLEDEIQRYGKNVAELLAITLTTLKLRVRLREQSIHDPLTGLYNRRYLDEVAHRELQRAARRGQPVGVALFDIDHFKRFNDEHGHDAGDAVLFQLTRFIESRLRAGDLAFRIGGEEFLLLLAEADREATLAKMEGFRREVETDLRVKHAQLNLTVTISAGVAAFPGDGTSLEDLLKAADTAMYRAKTMGRNCVFATGGSAPDTAPPV
jgi:diguanylate cyclase (GGDEF)-like protein/PAS domain S-box-containing protein